MDYNDTAQWTDQSLAQDARDAAAFRTRNSVVREQEDLEIEQGQTYVDNVMTIDSNQPVPPAPLSIDVGTHQVPQTSDETASTRAFKMKFGIPELLNGSYEDIYNSLIQGREQEIRSSMASDLDRKKIDLQNGLVAEFANDPTIKTPEAIASLQQTINRLKEPTNPDTVVEEQYSKSYLASLRQVSDRNEGTFVEEATKEIPSEFTMAELLGESLTFKNEWLLTQAQNIKDTYKKQGWGDFALDIGKQVLFPPYGSMKTRGGNVPFFEGGGKVENIEAQANASYHLPDQDFVKYWKPILDKMAKDNPSLALDYVSKLLGVAYTERFIGNMMEGIDLITGPGLTRAGIAIAKGASKVPAKELLEQTKTAVTQIVQSSAVAKPTRATIAEAAGDITEAAVIKASENIQKRMRGTYTPENDAIAALPSAFKQDFITFANAPGRLSRAIVDIIEKQTEIIINSLTKTMTETSRVQRLPALLENPNTLKALKDEAMQNYPGLSNTVGDIWIYPRKLTTGFDIVYDVLNPRGELFFGKQVAENFAKAHGIKDFKATPTQQGSGWFLRLSKPLDEKSDIVRDGLLKSPLFDRGNRPMQDWLNSFLGKYRTADENLSLGERQNRKVATYGTSNLFAIVENDVNFLQRFSQSWYKGDPKVKPTGQVEDFSRWTPGDDILFGGKRMRSRYEEWKRVLEAARDIDNKATGKKGYFFETTGELDQFYKETVKRLPDDIETQAYMAYKRIMEVDRQLRNIQVLKNKLITGTQEHTIWSTTAKGEKITSTPFDGIRRFDFPGGDNTILVMNNKHGKEIVFNTSDPKRLKIIKSLTEETKAGKRMVIEVHDPGALPLQNYSKVVGTNRVRYVITENLDTKPLKWEQVPRQGGGHFEYDYDFFIKQANVRPEKIGNIFRHWYEGDSTIMPVNMRSMGVDIADKMNAVRVLLKAGDKGAAEALAQKTLPIDWKEFKGWFQPRHIAGVEHPPKLDINEPFQVVERDKLIGNTNNDLRDRFGDTFRDGTRQGSIAKQHSVQFTGERDVDNLRVFSNSGSRNDPIYNIEPAKLVDPIQSMNRAFARISNSTFLDDYKIFAVEHWLENAKKFLKEEYVGDVRSSPFWHFNNPQFLNNTDARVKRQLMAQHYQIQQLMGAAGPLDGLLHRMSQSFADQVYQKTGKEIASPEVLSKLKDPFSFLRGIAFNMKLGLFALPQFVVQSMGYFNMYALAKNPLVATQGSVGALMHQFSRINRSEGVLNAMDNIASKFGWKKGEWLEATKELEKTGFQHVGGEYSLIDQHMSPKLVTSGGRQFLEAGQWAFREGERNARLGAWYIAFKEFKATKPTSKLSELDRAAILERADILNVNMSRASASAMHQGALSVPMQFYTYQLRLFELMTGTRITAMEKVKLLATNATLYGVPAATGLLGNPFVDKFREEATKRGYIVGDNFAKSIAMEGALSGLFAYISGGGDPRKGTWYNFADRYAMKGLDPVNNLLRGDKTWFDIFGGAAGGTLYNSIAATDGFVNAMLSFYPGRDPNKRFPLTIDDLIDVAQEVSSINMTDRYLIAINTGKWMSKKEVLLDTGVSKANAFFMSMTGLQAQNTSDAFNASKIMAAREKQYKTAEQNFKREIGRFAKAMEDGNPTQADKFHIRAQAHLAIVDYPSGKLAKLITDAYNTHKTSIDAADWALYMGEGVPQSKKQAYQEILERKLKLKNERNR